MLSHSSCDEHRQHTSKFVASLQFARKRGNNKNLKFQTKTHTSPETFVPDMPHSALLNLPFTPITLNVIPTVSVSNKQIAWCATPPRTRDLCARFGPNRNKYQRYTERKNSQKFHVYCTAGYQYRYNTPTGITTANCNARPPSPAQRQTFSACTAACNNMSMTRRRVKAPVPSRWSRIQTP